MLHFVCDTSGAPLGTTGQHWAAAACTMLRLADGPQPPHRRCPVMITSPPPSHLQCTTKPGTTPQSWRTLQKRKLSSSNVEAPHRAGDLPWKPWRCDRAPLLWQPQPRTIIFARIQRISDQTTARASVLACFQVARPHDEFGLWSWH